MADYKEQNVTGSSWLRAYSISIANPYRGQPSITFFEEKIIDTGDDFASKDVGSLSENFTAEDAQTVFNLVNPADGSAIGTATYQQVQLLLYGLYLHLANIRDTPPAPPVEPPPVDPPPEEPPV
jgi:hypothetical protein